MGRVGALVTVLAVTGVVAGAVAGCTPSAPDGPGLAGTIVARDDTGLGDQPIDAGTIVAVPAAQAGALWALADLGEAPGDVRHLGADVTQDALVDLGATRAAITPEGRFRLDAPAGPAVVCWADPTTAEGTMRLRGCYDVDLPASGELEASWSEGGFGVSVTPSSG